MLFYSTLPQFRDSLDKPLTNGRLAVYNKAGTTLQTIYYDSYKSSIAPNPFPLDDFGKLTSNFEIFEDASIISQKLIGYDELDNPIYDNVDTFSVDYVAPSISGIGDTCKTVGNISELRALIDLVDGEPVVCTGYYESGDCPTRVFVWHSTNTSAINTVNVFANATGGLTGRYVWQFESDKVDCRCCGIMANGKVNNSEIVSASSVCVANSLYLYFPDGHYTVTDGNINIYAMVYANDNVFFDNNNSGHCDITLNNPNSVIGNHFAGINCKLLISNSDWSNNTLRLSAFNSLYPLSSSSNFNLYLNNGSELYTFDVVPRGDWILSIGTHSVRITSSGSAKELKGDGKISWYNSNVISYNKFRSSLVNNYVEYVIQACQDACYLDSYVNITTNIEANTAHIIVLEGGQINLQSNCKLLGGFSATKRNFISGDFAINLGTNPIKAEYFYSANSLVKSFNSSTSKYLDMKGKVSDVILTKDLASVSNGTVGGITSNDVTLSKVIVTGSVDSHIVDADRCSFEFVGSNFINLESSNIRYSYIRSQSAVPLTNAVWTEVRVEGSIRSVGGNSRLNNVFVTADAYLIPNNYKVFERFTWIGGSADRINLDSAQMSVDGSAICQSTIIRNINGLANNINVINGSTKSWAINGHNGVYIGDNGSKSTRATYGTKTVKIYTFVASQKQGSVTGATDVCIMFNYNLTTPIESAKLLGICPRDNRRWFGAGYGQVIPTGNHINFTWTGAENPQVNELVNINFELYR